MDSENGKVRKKCRVCGDETSVFYNYRGLSCKSCKKFFLRNALKHEVCKLILPKTWTIKTNYSLFKFRVLNVAMSAIVELIKLTDGIVDFVD